MGRAAWHWFWSGSPNIPWGVNAFFRIVNAARKLLSNEPEFEAWAWNSSFGERKTRLPGTLLKLVDEMRRAGYPRGVDVASNRAGPSRYTRNRIRQRQPIQFTLRHTARSREGFALGAIKPARWIRASRVFTSFADILVRALRGGTCLRDCGTAMVTPFRGNGSLAEAALRKLVRVRSSRGSIFWCRAGRRREPARSPREEHLRVVAITIEESGRRSCARRRGGYTRTR